MTEEEFRELVKEFPEWSYNYSKDYVTVENRPFRIDILTWIIWLREWSSVGCYCTVEHIDLDDTDALEKVKRFLENPEKYIGMMEYYNTINSIENLD